MMKKKKIKNPLRKRYLRELKSDLGKYLVIFLLMVLSISEISGFLVADNSMLAAYDESFEVYNIEDGNFTTERKMSKAQLAATDELGISVYELFFSDQKQSTGQTVRLFKDRMEVNRICVMQGRKPEHSGEIALDRMYADNNGLAVEDNVTIDGKSYLVTGLVALSDYSCLFESNNDMMFDSKEFGVAIVSDLDFAALDLDSLTYRYAWKYAQEPEDEREEKAWSEDLSDALNEIVSLTGFVPRYLNQAITFTGEDMGSDGAMMEVFLYIIIVIIAFVFTVTISNTIAEESAVIGTLRAMGYTKGEMVLHLMTLPVIVTLVSSLIGNILGYTVLKQLNADLYYGSYSLPTYVTRWNGVAFFKTTIIPIVLMLVINLAILWHKLALSPLQFLRKELKKRGKRRAVRLGRWIPFFSRFRIRILFQNLGNYVLLLFGILFANFLLLFGLMFPEVLRNYQASIEDHMLCNYQYILQIPSGALRGDRKVESLLAMLYFQTEVETENEDAEKFSAYSLKTISDGHIMEEEITLYGVSEDSRYLNFPKEKDTVLISQSYAEKYGLGPGDVISLREVYEDTTYDFTVTGIYPYEGAVCVFLGREDLNERFDLGKGTFSGYFSDTEITDIPSKYIGTVIDYSALTKISRQLSISMGSMMGIVDAFAIIIFMVLIYLMSKVIIEKNAQAISLTKILGYTNAEISRLYILVTTIFVVFMMATSIPLESIAMKEVFRYFVLEKMSGWIPFSLGNSVYVTMFLLGIGSYALVALLEYRKLSKIPMEEALKNVE